MWSSKASKVSKVSKNQGTPSAGETEAEAQTESEEEVPEEEPLENNKVDGEANENEES